MIRAYPLAVERRRRYLFNRVDFKNKLVLEIGAMDMPTFEPEEVKVEYLDYYSDAEFATLAEQGALSRPLENLVSVSHVAKSTHFAHNIDTRFDLIIAAHVVEHVTDPLTWLAELAELLTPDGHIFLAIPDRRYTLDYLRQETQAIEFYKRFLEKQTTPDLDVVADFFYKKRSIQAKDVWESPDSLPDILAKQQWTLPQAYDRARQALISGAEHVNIHCSVFSYPTFAEVWKGISETGVLPLEIAQLGDANRNGNEFWALLKRKGVVAPANRRATHKRKFVQGKDNYLFLANDTNDTVSQMTGKAPFLLKLWRNGDA